VLISMEDNTELLTSLEPHESVFVFRDGEYVSIGFIRSITHSLSSTTLEVSTWAGETA